MNRLKIAFFKERTWSKNVHFNRYWHEMSHRFSGVNWTSHKTRFSSVQLLVQKAYAWESLFRAEIVRGVRSFCSPASCCPYLEPVCFLCSVLARFLLTETVFVILIYIFQFIFLCVFFHILKRSLCFGVISVSKKNCDYHCERNFGFITGLENIILFHWISYEIKEVWF